MGASLRVRTLAGRSGIGLKAIGCSAAGGIATEDSGDWAAGAGAAAGRGRGGGPENPDTKIGEAEGPGLRTRGSGARLTTGFRASEMRAWG
jgi:hypothetical protein